MTAKQARKLLGLTPDAGPEKLAGAFREAAKRVHPDLAGGDADAFRQVLEAYRLLQRQPAPPPPRRAIPPAPVQVRPQVLEISPLVAAQGGAVETSVGGRIVRADLPAGLRDGDQVRVAGAVLPVRIAGGFEALVRGDDLWLTVRLPAALLAEGGRAHVETAVGRRTVWISRQAAGRRLLKLAGQGLPARGDHAAGHLFLRLEADAEAPADSPARTLLKRFAAAWAA